MNFAFESRISETSETYMRLPRALSVLGSDLRAKIKTGGDNLYCEPAKVARHFSVRGDYGAFERLQTAERPGALLGKCR